MLLFLVFPVPLYRNTLTLLVLFWSYLLTEYWLSPVCCSVCVCVWWEREVTVKVTVNAHGTLQINQLEQEQGACLNFTCCGMSKPWINKDQIKLFVCPASQVCVSVCKSLSLLTPVRAPRGKPEGEGEKHVKLEENSSEVRTTWKILFGSKDLKVCRYSASWWIETGLQIPDLKIYLLRSPYRLGVARGSNKRKKARTHKEKILFTNNI